MLHCTHKYARKFGNLAIFIDLRTPTTEARRLYWQCCRVTCHALYAAGLNTYISVWPSQLSVDNIAWACSETLRSNVKAQPLFAVQCFDITSLFAVERPMTSMPVDALTVLEVTGYWTTNQSGLYFALEMLL